MNKEFFVLIELKAELQELQVSAFTILKIDPHFLREGVSIYLQR